MALRLSAMVKLFTPAYSAPAPLKPSGSLVEANEQPGCLTIDKGELVSIGQARSYAGKKDEEDEKPIPKAEEDEDIAVEKKSRKKSDRKSMEKQEELKRKPEPKPDATD